MAATSRRATGFRLTPQLIDVTTGEILWSDKIDVDSKDIISLQDTISQHIADHLSIRMSEAEQDRLARASTANHRGLRALPQGAHASLQLQGPYARP